MDNKQEFIEFMVRSGVLVFGSFKTKSGREAPYFINTGNYKTGEQLAKLGDFYARCIVDHVKDDFDVIYGPAYKGIPLSVATATSLYRNHGINISYCFNRKEAKDHGEGGNLIGYRPIDGDRILIVEDVITAGTSVRESLALLTSVANVKITNLAVSVDRMEKGTGAKTTLQELQEDYQIKVTPIVTLTEIISHLYNWELDGKVYIDGNMKKQIDEYLEKYGA